MKSLVPFIGFNLPLLGWRTIARKRAFGNSSSQNIRNAHTWRAYGRAIGEFLTRCERRGVAALADV
ncbi:hypothetical protein [Methylocystis echinoides]|uniref:Uncharacterized protein n=1 Tax=Methylocystis echinoides TaxID=29468 RepID=A0A9W6GZ22_9HYPH|nr:hypothetical protein [Methylocystis echinoides]GLI95743.1 hypothetical protein LMG27198_47350 [Methylocystis echinoides]